MSYTTVHFLQRKLLLESFTDPETQSAVGKMTNNLRLHESRTNCTCNFHSHYGYQSAAFDGQIATAIVELRFV